MVRQPPHSETEAGAVGDSPVGQGPDRLGLSAIPGASPDKWVTRWQQRFPHIRLDVQYHDDVGCLDRIRQGTIDMGYIRVWNRAGTSADSGDQAPDLPVIGPNPEHLTQARDSGELHYVQLYSEYTVVCAAADHWIAAAEESVTTTEIAEETFFSLNQVDYDHQLLEVVASGAGITVLPASMARALSRKDVVIRLLEDAPDYQVGLGWLRTNDSSTIQEFIGIARGRKASSARSELSPRQEKTSASKSAQKPGRPTTASKATQKAQRSATGTKPRKKPNSRGRNRSARRR